ncbi:transporter substrate-binding domain-containing diguanylate cyclase [Shewanella sp. 0m-8]
MAKELYPVATFPKGDQEQQKPNTISKSPFLRFAPLTILSMLMLLVLILLLTPMYPNGIGVSSYNTPKSTIALVIANSKAWKPFSYLDDKNEPRGLLIDLWKEFGETNQIEIQFLLSDWQESIDNVRLGKADIHAGLVWSNDRARYLDYANNLAQLEGQLFVEQSLLSDSLDSIVEHTTLGVIEGSYEDNFIRQAYPKAKFIRFKNNEQMIEAALRSDINAFVADFQVANFYLYTSNRQSAFAPVQHLYTASVKPAVAKGNEVLLNFVKNGFNRVEQDTLNRIQRKWLHVETVYPSYLLPLLIVLSLSMIAIYIIQLKRTVMLRTKELYSANQELQLLAKKDSLTGIDNRRAFMSEFERQNNIRKTSITLLLFDIDGFKGVNDTFGHQVGDQTIIEIVKRVELTLCGSAVFGRVGGEEFCVFLTGLNEEQAEAFANTIQRCISEAKVDSDAGQLVITVSLGAIYCKNVDIDCTYLMNQADLLMYKAKGNGRNCFEFSSI